MKSCLVRAGLLSLAVLLAGCDKAPFGPNQQGAGTETSDPKVKRAESGNAWRHHKCF
jgi:hypothetical protein